MLDFFKEKYPLLCIKSLVIDGRGHSQTILATCRAPALLMQSA